MRDYERLVMGGVWAQVDMRFEYDEESKGKNPFWIDKLTPIQIATFDLEEYRRVRSEFTTDEWLDLMVRSMGYEPSEMPRRLKLLFLVRLIPLAERNYNLVELGPRGTGKSYVDPGGLAVLGAAHGRDDGRQPFRAHERAGRRAWCRSGTSSGSTRSADLQKMPKEVITTMKTYCESGTFQRGQEAVSGDASIAMFGNTNQPIDVMVQTGHLFAPMPDVIRDDMAFIDRLHFYLPGWEIPKMRNDLFTDHYGFVVDYLAEALREMRKHNFTEVIDRHFSMGAHLNARDRKAVRKTVSGLMKILFPHGEVTQDELGEILEFALEGRRRVKEQLKKMGSFEYYHTSFSYTLQETGEEKFVGVPEQGGRDLISTDPLAAGNCLHRRRHIGRHRRPLSDRGLRLERDGQAEDGGWRRGRDEGIGPARVQLRAGEEIGARHRSRPRHLGLPRRGHRPPSNRVEAEVGVAFFVACYSAMRKAPVSPGAARSR